MNKSEKLLKLHEGLEQIKENEEVHFEDKDGNWTVKIKRLRLRLLIKSVLGITDPHTVNAWIEMLQTTVLSPNPHTQLSANSGIIKPSNDTYYILDTGKLKKLLATPTHTQLPLEQFSKPDRAMVQKEVTVSLKIS